MDDKMEPDRRTVNISNYDSNSKIYALNSTAISLKRIADALDYGANINVRQIPIL